MKKHIVLTVLLALIMVSAAAVQAVDRSEFDALKSLKDSALVLEANVFAPKTWEKATKAFSKANEAIAGNKKQKSVDKNVNEAREYLDNAIKATEVCKLTIEQYLPPRTKARQAKAVTLALDLYTKAEAQFKKATQKVESGDVKGGLKEAVKSSPMFNAAELSAIQVDILGKADKLIAKAVVNEAGKHALSTLDKARTSRNKANAIIVRDRYNREEAETEAAYAEYEALHASNIAMSVRSLKRNDQAWEKLMLIYEIQMNRVGESMGFDHLPFDRGPLAAADTLISLIKQLQSENLSVKKEGKEFTGNLTIELKDIVSQFDINSNESDPSKMSSMISQHISELHASVSNLEEQLEFNKQKVTDLSSEQQTLSKELSVRTEREEKFRKAKQLLNPSEGEVLFNSSNDIVLRLSGLSFDIGKSDIKDEHVPLLEKVKTAIGMFPKATLVIEGHTDASGEASSNVLLSEKRAYAVMQYLRQSLLIPADKIRSMGFGADKPVASNQTQDGRAKNRRIDIIIMQ